ALFRHVSPLPRPSLAKFRGDFVGHRWTGPTNFARGQAQRVSSIVARARWLRTLRRAGSTDGTGLSGKDVPMNPAGVAQSVSPLSSSDLSLFSLSWID